MAEPVPTTNPLGENTPPPPPSFENNPALVSPMGEPSMLASDPPPPSPPDSSSRLGGSANDVYSGPGAMPALTVAESPFPGGTNTPPPNPTDPTVMMRGETNFAAPATGAGVTTATILPTSSGKPEMISYPSSSGTRRNLMLPIIIGILVLLIVIAGGVFLFTQAPGETEDTTAVGTEETTPEPTEEPITTQILPTISYDNTEFNFTLDYPQGWTVQEGLNGNTAAFSDPVTQSSPNSNRITVRVENTLSDLNTYALQLQKIYSQLYTGWINVSSAQTTQGTTPAIQAENTYTKGVNNVSVLQLILVQGGKAYIISAEGESTAFEDLRPTFIQILASLKFKS